MLTHKLLLTLGEFVVKTYGPLLVPPKIRVARMPIPVELLLNLSQSGVSCFAVLRLYA